MFITDILNENGSFKSYREMQLNYNLNVNQFMPCFTIVCAIEDFIIIITIIITIIINIII